MRYASIGAATLTVLALVAAVVAVRVHGGEGGVLGGKSAPAARAAAGPYPGLVTIPSGQFERGDHHGFVDPKHGSDEVPVRTIRLDAFSIGIHDVTTREYCEFLNSALAKRSIEVRDGGVYPAGRSELLCETRDMSEHSRIGWDGKMFSVLDGKEDHPMVCVRWEGAAAYCNWMSAEKGLPQCYDASTWECDFNKSGFRLPTEAEWEYAARGGQNDPYWNFPWGDESDPGKANWPESRNPYRFGPLPWTTPVGFFDGQRHLKSDLRWPGPETEFRAGNGANGFGLFDMAGNVWQWCNDWYERNYYAYCPESNPPGPAEGSPMPDGKPYRVMRGGNWFNGEYGHSRVSNRDPSYFRGPQDPDHPFYHVGFRVVLPVDAERRPLIVPTPVQRATPGEAGPGGRPPRPDSASPGRRPLRGGGPRGGEDQRGGERRGGEERPRDGQRPPEGQPDRDAVPTGSATATAKSGFVLRSPAVGADAVLPKEYTGDGDSFTLPLEWSGAPSGTQSYALIMHHNAPDGIKWYWVVYDIPAQVTSLPKNVRGIGTFGNNSVNKVPGYAPPHSKGPGAKTYMLTLYALSAPPKIAVPPSKVSREVLLSAMKGLVLGTAELDVTYTRDFGADDGDRGPPPDQDRPPPRPRRD